MGNEVGILPESKSGRIGRKVLKYRSIESSDAATITDNFESGFSSTDTDASCKDSDVTGVKSLDNTHGPVASLGLTSRSKTIQRLISIRCGKVRSATLVCPALFV